MTYHRATGGFTGYITQQCTRAQQERGHPLPKAVHVDSTIRTLLHRLLHSPHTLQLASTPECSSAKHVQCSLLKATTSACYCGA